ncbi:hypothetical protein HMPREF2751_08425 [Corynebacterium sp. HMSC063G05]|uniref:acyltransferase family protein n=1 Tax=Corynebacterium sp. HMSC063G05 TaxID=1739255 RepID=UPI0008A335B1|nr:acyltransferase family protein [Corynebacterium sp. HMSC063G05]OFL72924.1 hypothetical protein HMPREF2751_08425 [Corynebacterium sp. HMSC063G05]
MTKQRLLWPDIAKGISILGVVQYHAVLASETSGTWSANLSEMIMPLRMGMFFFVSGIFAYKIRRQSLKTILASRIYMWAVPYFLWAILTWSIGNYLGVKVLAENPWIGMVYPVNGMWFLFSLTVCTFFVYLTKRLPTIMALLLAMCVPLLVTYFNWHWTYLRVFQFLPIFVAGIYLSGNMKKLNEKLAKEASRKMKFTAGALSAALFVVSLSIHNGWMSVPAIPGFIPERVANQAWRLLVYFFALPFGTILAIIISKDRILSKILSWYGRHTLPIYITNEMLVWIGAILFRKLGVLKWGSDDLYISLIFVLAILGGHVAIYLSERKYIGWIFIPPKLPVGN